MYPESDGHGAVNSAAMTDHPDWPFDQARLPPGWLARRDSVGGEWTREADPEL
jgi:hypothetical protein